ncbi:MAG: 1-acyl-sn-glycerol-3-phosphate acyltransferase [Clostridia bacterium]|nr:1-acyl-sn-glycerol-3-phosphate acyltransferase [Clostridia bacterium]
MSEQKVERTPVYTVCRGLFGVLFHTVCPIRYYNAQALTRAEAPYIIISNHKAAIDPFVLAIPVKKYEIRFIGKRELTGNKLVEWAVTKLHMIPVSRHATDMTAMRSCMQTLREGHVLGIFPEGTRHLPELMQTVESGAAMIALRANVPIIPVYLSGRVRPFHRVRVRVGEPMQIADIKEQGVNSDTIRQLCDRIRDTFYAMRDVDNSR